MKYWLKCTLCFLIIWSNYSSQNNTILYQKIDSCLNAGNNYCAAILFERLAFATDTINLKNKYLLYSAECYKKALQFDDALFQLKKINLTQNTNDTMFINTYYQSALIYYLKNELNNALNELTKLYYSVTDSTICINAYLLNAIIHNELLDWDNAKNILYKCNNLIFKNNTEQKLFIKRKIDSLYSQNNLPKLKKLKKSILLSTLFPGLGQMYTGNVLEGVISTFSHIFILSLTALGIYYQFYFTSIIGGSSLWAKFYTGNLNRTEYLTNKYNYQTSVSYNKKLKSFIINNLFKK